MTPFSEFEIRLSGVRTYALTVRSRTVFYTPSVGAILKQMKDDPNHLAVHMCFCISAGLALKDPSVDPMRVASMELLIVDEAKRLNVTALEYLRDPFDRALMGLILTVNEMTSITEDVVDVA